MTQIKLRRDTSANFTSANPILGNGEPAYETDTKKLKIGDGTTAYTQLEYFSAGGGSAPTNMVTTDTDQTITGTKTFGNGKLILEGWIKSPQNNTVLLGGMAGLNEVYLGDRNGSTIIQGDIRLWPTQQVKYKNTGDTFIHTGNMGEYVDGQTIQIVDGKLSATGGITTLATGYQDLPLPTREVWYKSLGNGYIAARFASTGANQFCQLGINSDGTGIPDSNSDYDGTQFSQGPSNKSTIILPISKDHYYSCNWNYGGGIIQLRFIQAINK